MGPLGILLPASSLNLLSFKIGLRIRVILKTVVKNAMKAVTPGTDEAKSRNERSPVFGRNGPAEWLKVMATTITDESGSTSSCNDTRAM